VASGERRETTFHVSDSGAIIEGFPIKPAEPAASSAIEVAPQERVGNLVPPHLRASVAVPSEVAPSSEPSIPAARVLELSKLYLDVALNVNIESDETRQCAADTVHLLAELEQLRSERIGRLEGALNGDASLGIDITNLGAIAFHLRTGYDNGNIGRNALASCLENIGQKLINARAALAAPSGVKE
jgi:hypothetical protein